MARVLGEVMKIIILTSIVLNIFACSTSTKTANLNEAAQTTVATVAALLTHSTPPAILPYPGVTSLTEHRIDVSGLVTCSNPFTNFNQYQLEHFQNNKLISIIKINSDGSYTYITKTPKGKQNLKLVMIKTNQILDQVDFTSTENTDRFSLNLNACP
jgi:hypothetical protein